MSWHETEDNSGQYELNNIWSVGKNSACIQMAAQCMDKRSCAGVFTDRDPEVRAGCRGSSLLLWPLMPAQGCPGCSVSLLRAASLGWDLGLEPCPIKSVLFAVCLQKSLCHLSYGRSFHGLTSAAGGDSWEVETCCSNYNFIAKPQTLSWEAKLRRGLVASEFFCSLRQTSLTK